MSAAAIAISAVGLAVLFGTAPRDQSGLPRVDAGAGQFLPLGIAAVCYLAQRSPYVAWRAENATVRTSPWLHAAGWSVLFSILTATLVVPVLLVVESILTVSALGATV